MRLGVMMLGTGAYAAANVGVLRALRLRGIEPYAVCGMGFGAWPAALHLYGMDEAEMEAALLIAARRGRRLLDVQKNASCVLRGRAASLSDGKTINRLLFSQAGERLLGLCERRGIFPCRTASGGRRVVFSSKPYAQGQEAALTMQATLAFACRAAMAQPPFLSPMSWMGSALLAEGNPAWAAGQLLRLGADRVLIVEPRAGASHEMDALELCAAPSRWALEEKMPEGTGILRVTLPTDLGALGFEQLSRIAQAGYTAAQAQLDATLCAMGLATSRILPFPLKTEMVRSR